MGDVAAGDYEMDFEDAEGMGVDSPLNMDAGQASLPSLYADEGSPSDGIPLTIDGGPAMDKADALARAREIQLAKANGQFPTPSHMRPRGVNAPFVDPRKKAPRPFVDPRRPRVQAVPSPMHQQGQGQGQQGHNPYAQQQQPQQYGRSPPSQAPPPPPMGHQQYGQGPVPLYQHQTPPSMYQGGGSSISDPEYIPAGGRPQQARPQGGYGQAAAPAQPLYGHGGQAQQSMPTHTHQPHMQHGYQPPRQGVPPQPQQYGSAPQTRPTHPSPYGGGPGTGGAMVSPGGGMAAPVPRTSPGGGMYSMRSKLSALGGGGGGGSTHTPNQPPSLPSRGGGLYGQSSGSSVSAPQYHPPRSTPPSSVQGQGGYGTAPTTSVYGGGGQVPKRETAQVGVYGASSSARPQSSAPPSMYGSAPQGNSDTLSKGGMYGSAPAPAPVSGQSGNTYGTTVPPKTEPTHPLPKRETEGEERENTPPSAAAAAPPKRKVVAFKPLVSTNGSIPTDKTPTWVNALSKPGPSYPFSMPPVNQREGLGRLLGTLNPFKPFRGSIDLGVLTDTVKMTDWRSRSNAMAAAVSAEFMLLAFAALREGGAQKGCRAALPKGRVAGRPTTGSGGLGSGGEKRRLMQDIKRLQSRRKKLKQAARKKYYDDEIEELQERLDVLEGNGDTPAADKPVKQQADINLFVPAGTLPPSSKSGDAVLVATSMSFIGKAPGFCFVAHTLYSDAMQMDSGPSLYKGKGKGKKRGGGGSSGEEMVALKLVSHINQSLFSIPRSGLYCAVLKDSAQLVRALESIRKGRSRPPPFCFLGYEPPEYTSLFEPPSQRDMVDAQIAHVSEGLGLSTRQTRALTSLVLGSLGLTGTRKRDAYSPRGGILRGTFGSGKSRVLVGLLMTIMRCASMRYTYQAESGDEAMDTEADGVDGACPSLTRVDKRPEIIMVTSCTNVAVDRLLSGLLKQWDDINGDDGVLGKKGETDGEGEAEAEAEKPKTKSKSKAKTKCDQILKGLGAKSLRECLIRLGPKQALMKEVGTCHTNATRVKYPKLVIVFTTTASCKKVPAVLGGPSLVSLVIADEASQISEAQMVAAVADLQVDGDIALYNGDIEAERERERKKQMGKCGKSDDKTQEIVTVLPTGRILLCGDPMQLSPVAQCKAMSQSVLDRWQSLIPPSAIIPLNEQFRCHRGIAEAASEMFYRGSVISRGPHRYLTSVEPGLIERQVKGQVTKRGGSVTNVQEQKEVLKIIKELLSSDDDIEPHHVCVISPYRAQCAEMQTLLQREGAPYKDIQAATVDAFQGQERPVVIATLARPTPTEFLDDEQRVNVSLTRAIHTLYIVHSFQRGVLLSDSTWGRLIQRARQNHRLNAESEPSIGSASEEDSDVDTPESEGETLPRPSVSLYGASSAAGPLVPLPMPKREEVPSIAPLPTPSTTTASVAPAAPTIPCVQHPSCAPVAEDDDEFPSLEDMGMGEGDRDGEGDDMEYMLREMEGDADRDRERQREIERERERQVECGADGVKVEGQRDIKTVYGAAPTTTVPVGTKDVPTDTAAAADPSVIPYSQLVAGDDYIDFGETPTLLDPSRLAGTVVRAEGEGERETGGETADESDVTLSLVKVETPQEREGEGEDGGESESEVTEDYGDGFNPIDPEAGNDALLDIKLEDFF
ncbi:hypothetical protein KIPB_000087 [Kipferlia bialata]|uniref:DNA2/NAM7 helicase-like C-terminal domain-containing protein n=1 Tax=Kipferlia bialata TaxID=797122 RepID=A0A9K3CMV2_9EUKA|nr:hypothetical protein KIPB_000087 [Kipferlia bialata]|eukprot:g87.t1